MTPSHGRLIAHDQYTGFRVEGRVTDVEINTAQNPQGQTTKALMHTEFIIHHITLSPPFVWYEARQLATLFAKRGIEVKYDGGWGTPATVAPLTPTPPITDSMRAEQV